MYVHWTTLPRRGCIPDKHWSGVAAASIFQFFEAFSFEEVLKLEGLAGISAGAGLSRCPLCTPAAPRLRVELEAALPHLRGEIRILLHLQEGNFIGEALINLQHVLEQ